MNYNSLHYVMKYIDSCIVCNILHVINKFIQFLIILDNSNMQMNYYSLYYIF